MTELTFSVLDTLLPAFFLLHGYVGGRLLSRLSPETAPWVGSSVLAEHRGLPPVGTHPPCIYTESRRALKCK